MIHHPSYFPSAGHTQQSQTKIDAHLPANNSFANIISMDPQLMIRLKAQHHMHLRSILVVSGDERAQVTVTSHPLLNNTKQLHLYADDTNKKCLQLAKKGTLDVPYEEYETILHRSTSMFAMDVTVDRVHLATSLILSPNDDTMMILDDRFELSDVLMVFKVAYDHLSSKVSGKINRKLKRYISNSKRSEADKKILTMVLEAQKQSPSSDSASEQKQQVRGEQPVQQKDTNPEKKKVFNNNAGYQGNRRDGGDRDNWRGNRNSKDNWNKNSSDKRNRRPYYSKEKPVDERITLGINGDTESGWRARYRPQRLPGSTGGSIEYKQEKQAQQAPTKQQKAAQMRSEQTKPVKQIRREFSTSNALKSSFSFPSNGRNFDFSKLKEFMLFINGAFWVKYSGGTLSITKGADSFIRKCDLTFMDNGFMGEGLTLSLEGLSNLEDGGDTEGNPQVSTFTLSDQQFFHVVTMEVYNLRAS